jgi:hypothetical protein
MPNRGSLRQLIGKEDPAASLPNRTEDQGILMIASNSQLHIEWRSSSLGEAMESSSEQRLSHPQFRVRSGCGRPGCACGLPISERFVLWALRQWQHDGTLPQEGSLLHEGFKQAGLIEVLPDFAIAMDAFLFGARRAIHIHLPTCATVSHDEATLVALCGLAQSEQDGPMMASLDLLMAPTASRVAGERLKAFASALAQAGLRLAPAPGEPGARVN